MYHEKLSIWQRGFKNTKDLYIYLEDLNKFKYQALLDQIKRSSLSIPSNIAEGASRDSKKEFRRFLAIALGSSAELQTQLELLKELVPDTKIDTIIQENYEISKMIAVFRKKLNH